jgi:hypothetical protein
MSRMLKFSLRSMLVGVGLAVGACSCLAAGGSANTETASEAPHEQSWYREQSANKSDSRAIVQQKAQFRAAQRMGRLASLEWYGMSNSRPTGSPTPFSTRYSPVWEMPGGRPFAWYPYTRPGYVMYWR